MIRSKVLKISKHREGASIKKITYRRLAHIQSRWCAIKTCLWEMRWVQVALKVTVALRNVSLLIMNTYISPVKRKSIIIWIIPLLTVVQVRSTITTRVVWLITQSIQSATTRATIKLSYLNQMDKITQNNTDLELTPNIKRISVPLTKFKNRETTIMVQQRLSCNLKKLTKTSIQADSVGCQRQ